jgi:hypothetical protein
MSYAETDETGAIANSVFDRAEVMREHLPLDVHLNIMSFFLRKSNRLTPAYMALQVARMQKAAANRTLGKE